jgi:hypothetical protein
MQALKGHTFISYEKLQKTVIHWFRQQTKEFFANGVCQLSYQWHFSNTCDDFFLMVAIP